MEKRTAIFICSGCDIGNCIDTGKLKDQAEQTGAAIVVEHTALCSENGLKTFYSTIEESKSDEVIVAACSPRYKFDLFTNGDHSVERVNLREQVAWVMGPGEDAQMAASDYLKMGMSCISFKEEIIPYSDDKLSSDILVVGGGITGITAALEGARAGYKVHLVEKEKKLGGYASKLAKQVPLNSPYDKLIDPVINDKIKEVEEDPNIQLYKNSTLKSISGQPGNFSAELSNGKSETLGVGAIVAAMGWKPYDAGKLNGLGYGVSDRVVTNVEFEQIIQDNNFEQIPSRVLFIQCAGSRDPDHLPYCSVYCCGTTLKQAIYVREQNPGSEVYVIYKDIRTPGLQEEFYQAVQKDDRILMTKGEVVKVEEGSGCLEVEVKESLIEQEILIEADMVVLAAGMESAGTEELNLQYRLGSGLPELKYNFPDSHFICFPYETRRTGIYAAGSVRAPMDIAYSIEDAAGAMFKAIQCIESVKRGEAVHPRSGDQTYPELFMDRCTDCKRCTEECPFGSYDENKKGTPLPNPARCRRCGICLGSCPERVISFADYSINMISDMIKAVEVPDEFEEKPRVLVFVCENDAYPAFDMAAAERMNISPYIRVIPVRCLGSINKVWISDALSKGFDGILQIGCKPGDDYQCHFIHGSELTEKRGENIQETLETMMLEPERIRTAFIEINEYHKIPELINDYMEEIELIGPNPFKDM